MPVFAIARKVWLDLDLLRLGLLEAQDIRPVGIDELLEGSLPDHCPYAVDVP